MMPFDEFASGEHLDEWSRKMNDIMDGMRNRQFVDFRDAGPWQPATNVYESPDAFLICIELSGVDEWEIDVESEPQPRVRIQGVREQPRPPHAGILSIHLLEIDDGPFRRELRLTAPIDVDNVEASFSKGYVWITVPKSSDP